MKSFKLLLFLSFTFLNYTEAKAQGLYHRHFFPIDEQSGMNTFLISYGSNDDHIFLLTGYTLSNVNYGYVRYYDGSNWYNGDTFSYSGEIKKLLWHKNSWYIAGKLANVNGKAASSGKIFSLLQLREGSWDSVKNSELPDTLKYKNAVANDEGIYMSFESSKSLTEIYHHNTSDGSNTRYQIETNLMSYGLIDISAGANTFIAFPYNGSMSKVNGVNYSNLIMIRNGTVSQPGLTGNLMTASVDIHGNILHLSDVGALLRLWNGSSDKDLTYDLGSKIMGALPTMSTPEFYAQPGVLNGTANTMYVLEPTATAWMTINCGRFSPYPIYSKNLGTFVLNTKDKEMMKLEAGALLRGRLFHDMDSSCTQNNGEKGLGAEVVTFTDGSKNFTGITDLNGDYSIPVRTGKVELKTLRSHLHYQPCSKPWDSVFAGVADTIDVPLRAKRGNDVEITMFINRSRWMDTIEHKVIVKNLGRNTANGVARFRIPAKGKYVSSSPKASKNQDDISWTYQLASLDIAYYSFKIATDNSSQAGDSLEFFAWLDSNGTDEDTLNNKFRRKQVLLAAYDPNSKHSYPEGDVQKLTGPIEYTIHFQNFGSDYARHVIVRDSLTELLNPASFEFLASSYPCRSSFENGTLIFNFSNIKLDYAAHDSEASKGWVSFRLKPKSGLKANTVIPNTAAIYFDFNPAVITNTSSIRLIEPYTNSSLDKLSNNGLSIYPNPANEFLKIEGNSGEISNVKVYNINGNLMISEQIAGESIMNLNIADLPAGLYILEINGTCFKFVKSVN